MEFPPPLPSRADIFAVVNRFFFLQLMLPFAVEILEATEWTGRGFGGSGRCFGGRGRGFGGRLAKHGLEQRLVLRVPDGDGFQRDLLHCRAQTTLLSAPAVNFIKTYRNVKPRRFYFINSFNFNPRLK